MTDRNVEPGNHQPADPSTPLAPGWRRDANEPRPVNPEAAPGQAPEWDRGGPGGGKTGGR
jgi:hypothetical protein